MLRMIMMFEPHGSQFTPDGSQDGGAGALLGGVGLSGADTTNV